MQNRNHYPKKNEIYPLIGRIAAEWANFEHILDQIIWDLTKGKKDINSCITGQIVGHGRRIKIIKILSRYRGYDNEDIKEINKLDKGLQKISENRNRYIHDAWFKQEAGTLIEEIGQFKSVTIENKKFGFEPVNKDDMLKTIAQIKKKSADASTLRSYLSERGITLR